MSKYVRNKVLVYKVKKYRKFYKFMKAINYVREIATCMCASVSGLPLYNALKLKLALCECLVVPMCMHLVI